MNGIICKKWEHSPQANDSSGNCGFLIKTFPSGRQKTVGAGSAVLVSRKHAISAAHNFHFNGDQTTYSVVFLKGAHAKEKYLEVKVVKVHNSFDDLCLMELESEVHDIEPAEIATDEDIQICQDFCLMGFGSASTDYNNMAISKGLLSSESFFDSYRVLSQNQTGSSVEVLTTESIDDGDSGGPVYGQLDGRMVLVGIQIDESRGVVGADYSIGRIIILDSVYRYLMSKLDN